MVRKSDRARAGAAERVEHADGGRRAAGRAGRSGSSPRRALTTRGCGPLAVLGQAVRRLGQGDWRRAPRSPGRGRDRPAGQGFNTMADASQPTGELARRAAAGAAGRAGGHRQPARSGASSSTRRGGAQRQPRRREQLLGARRGGRRRARRAPIRRCARCVERVREHVAGRQGRLRAAGLRGGACAVQPRDGDRCASARAATPVYGDEGGAVAGVDRRAAGRDPPAPLRRAEERPGRHRGARVPHAAHLPAHGDPSLWPRSRSGRSTTSRPICSAPRARTASGCRASSTTCWICRASARGRLELHLRGRSPPS